MQSLGMVLAQYPDHVVLTVSDPRSTGIQRKCKFPPSIAELVEACDREMQSGIQQSARERRIAEQMAARAEEDRMRAMPRPSYEELKAKYGENFGLEPNGPPKPDLRQFAVPPLDQPGDLANVFVPASSPRYAKLFEWSKTADRRYYKFDTRPGIWVSYDTWEGHGSKPVDSWKAPSWDLIVKSYAAQPQALARLIKAADDMRGK